MGVCNSPRAEHLQETDCITYLTELTTLLQQKGIGYAYFGMDGDQAFVNELSDIQAREGETTEKITYEMDGYDYSFYVDRAIVNALQY